MSERVPAPDRAARDLIRERLDVNLLVEAGAGSGKTECLAQRMAAGVLEGRYEVEQMAAVTFTRKAAAELRARFQLTLERRLAEERDERRRRRASEALRHLERLFAGTIHAFCAHLLRERPVEAGVAPGFTELDEVAEIDQRRRAWREHLDRLRAQGAESLRALLDTGLTPADLDRAFDIVCTFPEVDFPADAIPLPDPAPVRAALERFWSGLNALLPDGIPRETTCKVQLRMRDFTRRLRVAAPDELRGLAELVAEWQGEPAIVQKWWGGGPAGSRVAKAKIETLFADFHRVALPLLDAWYQHVYRIALAVLLDGRAYAAEARRRAVRLNYNDLLQYAATLLRDNLDVREALQRKYRWLFVDEFQDTDPIQAEVLLLLAAAGPERDWTRVPLRPGALFVVGDPKQSIYRFRRADIDIYQRVRQRIEAAGGRVVPLTACFRSVPALCDWANGTFGKLLPAEATRHQPGFAGLRAVRDARGPAFGVRILEIPEAVSKTDDVAAFDAAAIARFIRVEIDARRRGPGDFLILTRARRALPVYAKALEALRLPVEVSGGAAFAQSAAVTGLADLLRALADPDDGPAVVGVLRGPLFGLSDAELFRHRRAGGGFLMTAPELDDVPGPVGEALRAMRGMYRWTRTLPAPAAVERVLEATGLLAMSVAASPAGAEAGDLLHAVDRIRQVTEEGGTLADAGDGLIRDLESPEVESVPLEPGRHDVVRLMNLHKAKGLEAPVVFLADPSRGWPDDVEVRIVREGPAASGYFELARDRGQRGRTVLGRPAGWDDHQEQERAYVEAEQCRLVYVAATRARDLLVVSHPSKAGTRKRPWQMLEPYLVKAPALVVPPVMIPSAPALPDLSAAARDAATRARAARRETIRQASWQVESVTGTAHRAGPYGHPLQEGRTREPDTGMAWGSLIHFLLEHAMRGPRRDRAHLARLAAWFALDTAELRRVIPEALDTVERVMGAEFWREALAAEQRAVEVPFAVRVEGAGTGPRLLYGVIDLAFKTGDGWTLIDYKTDQLGPGVDVLAARYAPQIRAYADHWGAQLGARTRAGLHFIRNGETRWL